LVPIELSLAPSLTHSDVPVTDPQRAPIDRPQGRHIDVVWLAPVGRCDFHHAERDFQ
jgi:hypothetical protein